MSKLYFVKMNDHQRFQLSSSIVFLFIKMVRISVSFRDHGFMSFCVKIMVYLETSYIVRFCLGKRVTFTIVKLLNMRYLHVLNESSGNVMTNFFWRWHYYFKFSALLHGQVYIL